MLHQNHGKRAKGKGKKSGGKRAAVGRIRRAMRQWHKESRM